MSLEIKTIINGRQVPRSEVFEWERRRALIVLKKLGVRPASQDLQVLRRQLT